jgi:hypothetical protein
MVEEAPVYPSSLVAAWGDDIRNAWDHILADQYPLAEVDHDVWCDDDVPLRLACVRPRHGQREVLGVVRTSDCAVILDGRLDDVADSRSCAEEVIAAYQRWGAECAAHLAGEFSFVLWDGGRRRLLAACDRVGSRTLAYFFAVALC